MIAVHWFRRDIRLKDNTALNHALKSGLPVLPIFIFDRNILDDLPEDDARLNFIYSKLREIHIKLRTCNSGVIILKGNPIDVWSELISKYPVGEVHFNKDYEPYAIRRDEEVINLLQSKGVVVHAYKDQVVFEEDEVMKNDGTPYTVFTPYKKKWIDLFAIQDLSCSTILKWDNFYSNDVEFLSLDAIGIKQSSVLVRDYSLSQLKDYPLTRNLPAIDSTSYLSVHLRYGTVSIRGIIGQLLTEDTVFLNELIWREFFMQVLFHYPRVVTENFRTKYNGIQWRNNNAEFDLWCKGQTGYSLVDAGMRQLNETGFMHNRVRMITAGFLCKHLLIDWRWGEAYFAQKLLDFELSSNNGNWQWSAGTGCDAAPYFRIFNPLEQQKKFDKDFEYIKKWIPEYGTSKYPEKIIDHKLARERALKVYKRGIRH